MYLCRSLFLRFRKRSAAPINVLVFSTPILDEFKVFLGDIPDVRFFLMAGYTKGNFPASVYQCGLFVVDEAHHIANEDSAQFSQALSLTRASFRLLLSATFSREQKGFLERHGIHHEFHIPLKTGVRLKIVPNYQTLNVPLELTPVELKAYQAIQEKIDGYIRLFELAAPDKPEQLAKMCAPPYPNYQLIAQQVALKMGFRNAGGVIGSAIQFRSSVGERARILYEAENKQKLALSILKRIPVQPVMLFGNFLRIGDKMARQNPGIQVYRTAKTKAEIAARKILLQSFYSLQKPFLFGCQALNEGFTVDNCSLALNLGVNSKDLVSIQRIGRLLGLDLNDPNKLASMVNLYIQGSQEEVWIKRSQRGQLFINYLTGPDELTHYLPMQPIHALQQ